MKTLLHIRSALGRIGHRLMAWRRRLREHARLRELTDDQLRDAGLTPTDVITQLKKPFWRV